MTYSPRSPLHLPSGRPALGLWQSPGRVNLIGEFTDYNDGHVLPFAIDRRIVAAVGVRKDRTLVVASRQQQDVVIWPRDEFDKPPRLNWASYVMGVIWAFRQQGVDVPGLEIALDSDVPLGAGLSSSAALTAVTAVAINDITSADLSPTQLAGICLTAENDYVGVPTGMMDQFAVIHGRAGHAMLIDCELQTIDYIPLDLGSLLVVNTQIRRSNADGNYAKKRRQCALAAEALGVSSLRHANIKMVEEGLRGEMRRIARHVVTEEGRVLDAAGRLIDGRPIGDLLVASHRSLHEDFVVTIPELDCVVDTAMNFGAAGARMMGAGMGGCAIVVCDDPLEMSNHIELEFRQRGFKPPECFTVTPSPGAGVVT